MEVTIESFGFKYGAPQGYDLTFDVRFLPNPFYIEELTQLNGKNQKIRDFVLGYDASVMFLSKLNNLLEFLIPTYEQKGNESLRIGIGCTGGKHRSVALAEELFFSLQKLEVKVIIHHRDVERG